MPATSKEADELADQLVLVGKVFGFESVKEAPVLEKSTHCVDVLWKLQMPKGSPFPAANVASIEIQYSDSPVSISHNIFKAEPTLHPSYHIIISHSRLSEGYKKILQENYPKAGLVILDGESDVNKVKVWVQTILEENNEADTLAETGKKFLAFVGEQAKRTTKHLEERDSRFDWEYWFTPTVFRIDVEWTLTEIPGTFTNTYFFTDTIEKARKRLLEAFEEDMSDMPLEWEGQYASLEKMKICCYEICRKTQVRSGTNENSVVRVVITAKVGSQEANFETTFAGFGENAEETEADLIEKLHKGVDRMKNLPHEVFEQQVHIARYSRIACWKEKLNEKVLVLSKDIMPREEQKERIQSFFSREFSLDVECFLSLDDVTSAGKYFENFEIIKNHLREVFRQEPSSFRNRMSVDDFRKLEDWLLDDA